MHTPGTRTDSPKWERFTAGKEILRREKRKCKLPSNSKFYLGRVELWGF